MSETILRPPNVRDMHQAVHEHVQKTKHKTLCLSDDLRSREVGVLCSECTTLWRTEYPLFLDGPHGRAFVDLYKSTDKRREVLAMQVSHALNWIPPTPLTVWDRLRSRSGVGW